ncbi:acyl-n-acyltransferase [Favolaschia claudopus]|uniref:Acyl-n-acyltransferase n=1 Tax=Favolaschia claudopus TaxID=2862362 RepID=A0AAW0D5K3_9AGAR
MPGPKPLPLGLVIHQATPKDLFSLATLLAMVPDDGSLYRFPHILEHIDEMRDMHIGWLRPAIHEPTNLIRIAVVPTNNTEQVVGFTSWTHREIDPHDPSKTRLAKIAVEIPPAEETANSNAQSQTSNSRALIPNKDRSDAIKRARKRSPPSPAANTPCYELGGLAIHPDFQGQGIGSLLVRWGIDKAAEKHVPVFVTGETQGVEFYEQAIGFRRLPETEYWLDEAGRDITREEVLNGNETWKKVNGGLSGSEMVWLPDGYVFEQCEDGVRSTR